MVILPLLAIKIIFWLHMMLFYTTSNHIHFFKHLQRSKVTLIQKKFCFVFCLSGYLPVKTVVENKNLTINN